MLDDDRRDALDVLADSLHWHLSAGRWIEVEQLVRTMARALADGDERSFRRATADLELLGPVRAASAESPPREPAGERVRERINELITSLVGPRPEHPPADDRG
ncbi:CATRA system-associated protein [Pseudonocardia humida]|uniref:CATRA-Associated Small Protein domain-containing protein n=1 Tax=Pseudonocardia humida TaxID=2800819 RepID=A0ABT0ZY10_9PSEU|nr:CATRA system-associated protein [Pseudonocardia humida]MCO1655628.1 hypothetical protein [Pseudonocardia humida]